MMRFLSLSISTKSPWLDQIVRVELKGDEFVLWSNSSITCLLLAASPARTGNVTFCLTSFNSSASTIWFMWLEV